jgi:protein SCO1
VTRLLTIAIFALVLVAGSSLRAAVTERDVAEVAVLPPSDARVPLDLPLQGEDGSTKPLKFWLGITPGVLLLADYTCETLCGPVIGIVSDALARSGLRAGADFRLLVVGLDPKDTPDDAARMKQAQAGLIDNAVYFLRGDAAAIGSLARTLGFHSVYDREHDQFAHPAAAFVIAPDGRLARSLSGLAVDPSIIRLAIIGAGSGSAATWADHIRLLCYGYDPARGTYSVAIGRILAATAGGAIAVLALLIGLLLRHERAGKSLGASVHRSTAPSRMPTTD